MQIRYVREITQTFPYPITSHFVKLRTDECLEPSPLRLQYILSTIEAISRYLGLITIIECRELAETQLEFTKDFLSDFTQQIQRPSWGVWLNLIREGLKWLHHHNANLLIPELYPFYFNHKQKPTQAAKALATALNIRNQLSHEKIRLMMFHEFEQLCNETYPLLSTILKALNFLPNYPLAFVSQIEVRKDRKQAASFYHRFKSIVRESEEFYGERDTLDSIIYRYTLRSRYG